MGLVFLIVLNTKNGKIYSCPFVSIRLADASKKAKKEKIAMLLFLQSN